MTKRRRPGASKRLVEARFWGQPPAGASQPTSGEDAGSGDAGPTGPTAEAREAGGGREAGETRTLPGIRPTPDPGALVRSLGPPPLAVDAAVAERHLTAVYEEAVRAATALAAVNGLLATDDPADARA